MKTFVFVVAAAGCLAATSSRSLAGDGTHSPPATENSVRQPVFAADRDGLPVTQVQYRSGGSQRAYGNGDYGYPRQYNYGPRRYVPLYNDGYSSGGPYVRYSVPSPYAFGSSYTYGFPQPGGYRAYRPNLGPYPFGYGYNYGY